MSIRVREAYAIHEGGGKFYKVYSLAGPKGGALITHWGKIPSCGPTGSTSPSEIVEDLTPREGGQHKVESLSVTGFIAAMGKKTRRGYSFIENAPFPLADEVALRAWCAAALGSGVSTRDVLRLVLGDVTTDAESSMAGAANKPKPKPRPDARSKVAEFDLDPVLGSW